MKLKHVGIIVVSVLAMSSAAVSAAEGDESVTTTVNGGVIHFKGEVVNAACAIDSESMNQTVELGQVRSSRLAKAGDLSSAVGFNIKLNDCDTNVSSNAAVAFLGTTVTSNDDTLALQSSAAGSAQNVGIQILDRTGEVLVLPLKLYITPVGAAGGVVIKSGEVIARIHMYKIATLGSGNPRNFTWNIISNNSVVMPTGGCTVDSRNVTVNLPDFPGSAEIPLGVYCSSEQKLSFYLSGATTDSARQVFANTAPDATKASGVGVSLMRNGKTLATGENVSLGTVNKSKVPLGLSATYGQTGNKVAAGAVQSVIGVTFIYE